LDHFSRKKKFKMKKIKVYLQYPWKVSDSQYYKSLIENPPEGIKYIGIQKSQGIITNYKKFLLVNFLKQSIRWFLEEIQFAIPNAHKTDYKKKCDLIHCAHCLSLNKTNWVADFESLWQMWISGKDTKKGRERVLKLLIKDNCKKIIAWTEDTKKEISLKFPEIKNKLAVISFAMPLPKIKKINHKELILLFIGRYFYEKGGLHTLEVFDRLTKKYKNVKCLFVSQTPKEILKKYSLNKKIKFFDLMPHQSLIKEIFPKADILIYPGYSDTFGFGFIEAMSFGLPIVTVDGFARRNIVDEGKTGFIIKRQNNNRSKIATREFENNEKKIIEELVEKTSLLIENKELRKRMSRNCIKIVKEGKFSIKERNKNLERIYEEALR
jgi:glycosyltransferase involved in cell wall biosynthesis